MQKSLQILEQTRQTPGDELLAFLVRLQFITERITLSEWYDNTLDQYSRRHALQPMYMQVLLSQVRELPATLADYVRTDGIPPISIIRLVSTALRERSRCACEPLHGRDLPLSHGPGSENSCSSTNNQVITTTKLHPTLS